MDDKVYELVEWVANGISLSVCAKCAGVGEVCDNCRLPQGYEYETAYAILSHPDLALMIDPCRIKGETKRCGVIPLADAIKDGE